MGEGGGKSIRETTLTFIPRFPSVWEKYHKECELRITKEKSEKKMMIFKKQKETEVISHKEGTKCTLK